MKTTDYVGGLLYESKLTSPADDFDYSEVLQFIPQEERRIRFRPIVGATPAKFSVSARRSAYWKIEGVGVCG